MKTNVKKQNSGDFIMIVAIVVSVLKNMMDSSAIFRHIPYLSSVLLLIFFVCMAYKLLTQQYTPFLLVLFIGIALITAYSGIAAKYYSLFYSYIFAISLQKVNLDRLLKASIITKVSMILIHVLVYIAVYVTQHELIVFYYRNGIERQSFFLGHPNMFTAYLVWVSLEVLYVFRDKLKGWHYIAICLLNFFFYLYTNSNTGTIVLLFVCVLLYLNQSELVSFDKGLQYVAQFGFAILAILLYIFVAVYPLLSGYLEKAWRGVDRLFTGRLLYGAYANDTVGITLFGRMNHFPAKTYWRGRWLDSIYFDNSVIELLYALGAVLLIIYAIAFIYAGKRASNVERIMMIAFFFYGVMEGYFINIFICFPFMFLTKYIFENQEGKTKKQKDIMEGALWKRK